MGLRPGVLAVESQADEHDDRGQRPYELHRRIAFEEAYLLAMIARAENDKRQPQLRQHKNDARNNKRAVKLIVDLRPKLGNGGRKPPNLSQEEVNRYDGENYEESGQCERNRGGSLLFAFSGHLPPLRTIRSRDRKLRSQPVLTLPPLINGPKTDPDGSAMAAKTPHHIHPSSISNDFSLSSSVLV